MEQSREIKKESCRMKINKIKVTASETKQSKKEYGFNDKGELFQSRAMTILNTISYN